MTSDKGLLYDVKEGRGQTITFGNNETIQISRVGKIASFHSQDRPALTFPIGNTYSVPSMHKNILFVSQLDKQQMSVLFKGGKCTINDKNDQVITIVHEDHGLYKLDASNIILDTSPAYISQSLTKE